MKKYYIFNVKKNINKLYYDNPSNLYKILEKIYFMHEEDLNYGFNLFKELTNKIKVFEINDLLYTKLHNDLVYSKVDNEHVINDLYQGEISILKVKPSHLLLESNKSYSCFFNLLSHNTNYFVCDFMEKDFFFINDIKNLINS